ncbi:hypothetical protein BVX95_00885 [archaeon D22]|nr:hypothetical protein BVX95_00885 [archaeon D22]
MEKLVRDNIPKIIEQNGETPNYRVSKDEEYEEFLIEKLIEETNEFMEDKSEKEFIDILEVLDEISDYMNFDLESIKDLKEDKSSKRGKFKKRFILEMNDTESIIEKSKNFFIETVKKHKTDPYGLLNHVYEVEKWALKFIKKYPEIDSEVLLVSAWLHDIGHYPLQEIDHAITGEKIAKEFLTKNNYPSEKIAKVLHCIRCHRNKDVKPKTIEARALIFCDSASHMTDHMYLNVLRDNTAKDRNYSAKDKLIRDYNDLDLFPEMKEGLTGLYHGWLKLIEEYEKILE